MQIVTTFKRVYIMFNNLENTLRDGLQLYIPAILLFPLPSVILGEKKRFYIRLFLSCISRSINDSELRGKIFLIHKNDL